MPPEPAAGNWRRSPFYRFALVLPAVIALIVGALFYPLFIEAQGHIRDEVQAAIELEIEGLETHFHERGLAGLREVLQRRMETADGAALYLLTDAAGTPLVGNLAAWPAGVEVRDESWFRVAAADGGTLEGRVFLLFGGDRLLVGRRSPLADFQRSMSLRLWGSAALITLVAAALGWHFMRQIHRRLERMAQEAGRIQGGLLGQRLSVSEHGDELDLLAQRFNSAFDEIERLVDAAKHVSSAIAHDMRRPLIALRNALDEARRDRAGDPALAARLEKLRGQTDELLRTFAALLSLARIEAGAAMPARQGLDLATIAGDAIELYEAVAEAEGRSLRGELAAATVRGDRDLLFQVCQNLIENALAHGAGDILVSVERVADEVALRVSDQGRGVSDEALPRLFERFFRGDAARSAQGAGIGLALVKGIAEAHGGRVSARRLAEGFEVGVILPLAVEAAA